MAWWARLLIGIAVFIGVAIIGFVGQIIATKRKKDEADFWKNISKTL